MSELKLNEYQTGAVSTAIYPDIMMAYPALGLCGEVGELIAAINKDRYSGECSDNLDSVKKEIGDVLWYAANIAEDMDTRLSEVMGRENFEVCPETWNIDDALIDLPVCAGEVAENIKKAIRDNDGAVSYARGRNILAALCLLVIWLERLCSGFGATLEECAQLNLDKLRSRAERDAIKGEGDYR
jgi:NTP pyrophosphatase (non-canonical NTP hydrolase)